MWSTDEERSAVTVSKTVGFVDLVGYTSTTTSLTVRELTKVLIEFDKRTAEVVGAGNGYIVKMIGDEAMFVAEEASDACRIAIGLVDGAGGGLPPVRVGLASGEMVSVFGDFYGSSVNLAARLVAVAEPSTAVVSETARSGAGPGFNFEQLSPFELKGFSEPVIGYRLR
jgi:adenylate cyclase